MKLTRIQWPPAIQLLLCGDNLIQLPNLKLLALSTLVLLALTLPAGAQTWYATPYACTNFVGLRGTNSYQDGVGTNAWFNTPEGIAFDGTGNLYVVDERNQVIRKVTPAGVVTTLAGNPGVAGYADGTGTNAQFNYPFGCVVDSSDNVYVMDELNQVIRKVTPAGVVTTLAGNPGVLGYADGTGTNAEFYYATGVAMDNSGNIIVADQVNDVIRKVTLAGVVTTLAGNPGVAGYADGTGTNAEFHYPNSVAVDSGGNIIVADSGNNVIRKIDTSGNVTTIAGTAGVAGSADGTGSAARFNDPTAVAVDTAGNIYVGEYNNHALRKIDTSGNVTTLAGTKGTAASIDGIGSSARFTQINGVAVASNSTIYVSDWSGDCIVKCQPALVSTALSSSVSTPYAFTNFAGLPGHSSYQDGTGTNAWFNQPEGLAVDSSGNVYVGDEVNQVIRKITPAGVVTTLAGNPGVAGYADGNGTAAEFYYPDGVAVDNSGNLYVADELNDVIRMITPAGDVTTLAGTADAPGYADGTGINAQFYYPTGVAVDSSGNVYVADQFNDAIRKVTSAGVVTTLAGDPGVIGYADGTGTNALFKYPNDVAVDGSGNVYVTDSGNNMIRKITPAGVVTTLAGSTNAGSADGIGSAARFNGPTHLALDSAGNLYVSDYANYTIRKVTPAGAVTTIAGSPGLSGTADGIGSAARFYDPVGVALDSAGDIYVADWANSRITKGTLTSPKLTLSWAGGGILQSTANLAGTWTNMDMLDSISPVMLDLTGPQEFYRIH